MNAIFHMDIFKIQKLLRESFKTCFSPSQNVAVDEGIVPFKGRFKYRQYVRGKPHSTGIKFYALADTSGYIFDFWIYAGNSTGQSAKPQEIVENLVKTLPRIVPRYCVYADCFYGSEKLAISLHSKGYDFVLSCQGNRPSYLFTESLDKGLEKGSWKSLYNQKENMIATSFHDTGKYFQIT